MFHSSTAYLSPGNVEMMLVSLVLFGERSRTGKTKGFPSVANGFAHESPAMAKKPADLTPNEFPKIAWQPGKLAEPLGQLFDCAVKEANDSITWYGIRKKPKQFGGQILRVGAIIFAAIAGLVPVV